MSAGPESERTPPPAAMTAGDRFGRYRLLRVLGSGGMGTVFLALQEDLGRQVALKVVRSERLADSGARERFHREAAAIARLDHRGICALYESGEVDGCPFLAMRVVEGQTLAARLQRAQQTATDRWLSPIRAADAPALAAEAAGSVVDADLALLLATIERVARALHHAHVHGIVHRDVKPGNIVLEPSGEPVLLDFGLARDQDAMTLTRTNQLLGTPAYMAPEQVAAYGRRPGPGVDVYALGVTLYELLTLQLPFLAGSQREMFEAILFREPTPVRQLNPRVPRDLEVVLARALEKDPRRRYATAVEFADELQRVRRGQPVLARPAGALVRLRRWTRRNRLAVTVMAGVGAALLALLAGAAVVQAQAERLDLYATWSLLQVARAEEQELYRLQPRSARAGRLADWLQRYGDPGQPGSLPHRLQQLREVVGAVGLPPVPATAVFDGTPDQLRAELDGLREVAAGVGIHATHPSRFPGLVSRRTEYIHETLGRLAHTPAADASSGSAADPEIRDLQQLAMHLQAYVDGDARQCTPGRPAPLWAAPSALARVAAALEWERTGRPALEQAHADAWRAACDRVAADESPYDQLLSIQHDLVPLGPDPDSHLEEFAYPRSGELPRRDPTTRRLLLTDDMAIVFVLVPGANKAQVGTFQPLSGTGSAATSGLHPTFFSYLGFDQIARLDCFLLSKFELTQFQWARLGGGNPSNFQGDCLGERITPRNPVESVSWQRAREVLGWHDMDLPTEFQWEYACGVKTEGGYYWGNGHPPAYENSFGGQGALAPFLGIDNFDGHMLHTPVGTFLPNPWGFHDLLGNVAELCRDGYAIRPMAEVRERDGLRVAGDTEYCVGRGGAFVTGGHRFSRMPLARDWLLPVLGVRPIKHLQRD